MTVPKLKADWTINFPVLGMVAAAVLYMGAQQQTIKTLQHQYNDLESRVRTIEGPVIERLIRLEEKIDSLKDIRK